MNWHCVFTRPNKEAHTAQCIEQLYGLPTFFPCLQQQRIIRRVKRVVTQPLFPQYFFCRFDSLTHYRAVRFAPDALALVQSGDHPALVSDQVIAELRQVAAESHRRPLPLATFTAGETVEITRGLFSGFQGRVLHTMNSHARVALLLSMLNAQASVVVENSLLERVAR